MSVPPAPSPPLDLPKRRPKLAVDQKNKFKDVPKVNQLLLPCKIGVDEVRDKLKCLPAWRNEQLTEQLSTWVSVYHPVAAILQDGPQCGIVALCMASHLLQSQPLTPDIAFETARSHGFTMYGEMFSVKNMCELAGIVLNCEATRLTHGLSDSQTVLEHLDNGFPILVPYDKDESNAPCCRRGNKAHWAVITGYLVQNVSPSIVSMLKQDHALPNLYHKPKDIQLSSTLACRLRRDQPSVYVYGKQGKSRHLGIWSYRDLLLSNSNLLEWHAGKNDVDEKNMVLADGGIEQGLCDQIVLLKPKV